MDNLGHIVLGIMFVGFYGLMFYSAYKGLKNAIYKSEIRKKRASFKLIKGEDKDV
jgi:hypothetical protein